MNDTPNVPTLSPLGIATVAMYEMFTALTGAGFTEDQALRLIAYQCRQPPQ